ncbi:uncharacterized protein LOC126728274 [Quercus robur]|uniref:uncharacterized protein LOC126728274 n=1 Tax=Quercus robur TaxID=38942 RepID=UPI002163A609|nr:uncharacterized protein LOC126728274 [Quercus robur]
MPFGLKNAGAMDQRLVNQMFSNQIRRNVEVYVDDMLVKSKEEENHLDDLRETFNTLRQYNMKLNPSKCAFGVSSRKFLGFMVSQRGIEANPEKVRAILEMSSPKMVKEVQSLTGRVAALNSFVSKATDKCLPFFKTLKQAFVWTEECETAFQELKRYLSNPLLLSLSKEGEDLFLYLAVSIPWGQNVEADEVAQSAFVDDQSKVNDWRLEEQNSPSIEEFQTFRVHTRSGWTCPILSYLKNGRLPPNLEEAKKIKKSIARFKMLNDELYKRGFSQPYLRSVEEEEAKYVLEEVHKGICGDHIGAKSFIQKITSVGYFWPTMQQDTVDFVKRCDRCQRYGNVQQVPGEKMTTISSPWTFA